MFKKIMNPPKKYILKNINQIKFFEILNKNKVRYVLLRWWKSFPEIEKGEDFDILVHRSDFKAVESMLTHRKGGLRCDVYFHDAPGGSSRKKVAYFPISLANQLLENRILWREKVYVPAPRDYFASLAFHALYHKGAGGGLFGCDQLSIDTKKQEHDYVAELTDAALEANIKNVSIDADGIQNWLRINGFSPPLDMLGKLADKHPELIRFAELPSYDDIKLSGELILFVVRRVGGESEVFLRAFIDLIKRKRLEVLEVYKLTENEVESVSHLRGGNWGKGPYWKSAGKPHTFVICYDWYPKAAGKGHSLLLNGNITKIKNRGRELYNKYKAPWYRCNPVHSPDNELEAFEFFSHANPDLVRRCKGWISERKNRFTPKFEILEILSEGRRSRTALIEFNGGLAVQKTFKIGFENLCKNEVEARVLFTSKVDMPNIIQHDHANIIIEYLAEMDFLDPGKLGKSDKMRVAHILTDWIYEFWNMGYFHADFAPRNFLVAKDGSLKMIDCEFLQPYHGLKPSFDQAFEFEGVPTEESGYEVPVTKKPKCIKYHHNWKKMKFEVFFQPRVEFLMKKYGDSL